MFKKRHELSGPFLERKGFASHLGGYKPAEFLDSLNQATFELFMCHVLVVISIACGSLKCSHSMIRTLRMCEDLGKYCKCSSETRTALGIIPYSSMNRRIACWTFKRVIKYVSRNRAKFYQASNASVLPTLHSLFIR